MRVSCVQNYQRNEIIVVNRKPSFSSKKGVAIQRAIDKLDINMDTKVGGAGRSNRIDAPDSVGENLAKFFRSLEIDWRTHVDPAKKPRRFE